MNKHFIAKGERGGKKTLIKFDKSEFNKEQATELLKNNDVSNFFFYFEPEPPMKLAEGVYLFSGEVGFDITLEILLPHLKNKDKIVLNSGGGYNWDATQIHDYIKIYQPNSRVSIMGLCASATNQILLAAKPENRTATKNSKFMIHNAWSYAVGDHDELREQANTLEQETNSVIEMYIEASNNKEEIELLMSKERIFNTEKALELNFISKLDATIEVDKDNSNSEDVGEEVSSKLIINNKNRNKMSDKKNFLADFEKKMKNFMNSFSAENLILHDTEGHELDFGSEIKDKKEIEEGMKVSVNGASSTLNATLEDGTVYEIEKGKISKIIEAENKISMTEHKNILASKDSEIQELKNSLAEQKGLVSSEKAKVNKLENSKKELKKETEKMFSDFEELKNSFKPEKNEGSEVPKNNDQKTSNRANRKFKK